jgi:hypothetical protein
LLQAATAVSGAVLHGAGGAFEKLLHLGENALAETTGVPETGSLAGLQARADELRAKVETHSLAVLAKAGITLDAPLMLERDALGDPRVVGDHPQAATIERALAGDRRFADLVEELHAANCNLIRAREAEASERLFALDPDAARKSLDRNSPLQAPSLRLTLRSR